MRAVRLPFFLDARRRRPPHPRSSPFRPALSCTRIAASTRFAGVIATVEIFIGAAAATASVRRIPTLTAQAARCAAPILPPLARVGEYPGPILPAAAAGWTRHLRAEIDAMSTASRFGPDFGKVRSRWRSVALRALHPRPLHLVGALLAAIIILPVTYVAYC